MLDFIWSGLKAGFRRMKEHPQLVYTVIVAIAIFVAFVFMASRFISIAQDAQDRLVNVRVGSIQDAFVEFAYEDFDQPRELRESIRGIAQSNTTIRSFRVIDVRGSQPRVIAALNDEAVGGAPLEEHTFLYNLAISDPQNSFTVEMTDEGERFFVTARAIRNPATNEVSGVVMTRQTLSEADKAIDSSIRNSIMLFVVVIALVMFLFFRHAKIIDYAALYKKLKEVDQLKDDFISMASHELRTPLTTIRGYAEFLRDESDNLNDEQQEYMRRIMSSAEHLDNLVADILDVSRIEQGRLSFEYETVDPQETISTVVEQLTNRAEEKGLKLIKEAGESAPIEVDPDRFQQVLVNLVGNAVKYTPEGEIRVKRRIDDSDNMFEVRVSDTGVGMSEEEQEQLFQKFSRVGDAEQKKIRGTGLGLWISKQIVEQMGGTISVESIEGKGSDFIIRFPIIEDVEDEENDE